MSFTRKIASNTIYLYVRMILAMFINLITTRIVLNVLGVEDYGVFIAVFGLVSFLTFINQSFSGACYRFFSYELGKRKPGLSRSFSSFFLISFFLSLFIILVSETIGLWFLNNQIIIPDYKSNTSNIIFHFFVLTVIVSLLSVPFSSVLISLQKFKAYSIIGIIDIVLKLAISLIILYVDFRDSLLIYSTLLFLVYLLTSCIYVFYALRLEIKISFNFDKLKILQILNYFGWNTLGSITNVLKTFGVNVLMSIFFIPSIVSARGVSMQLSNGITLVLTNFYLASRPSIFSLFSQGKYKLMNNLINQSSRFSFYLLLALVLPILFEAPFFIELWLVDVPQYSVEFLRLSLIIILIESLTNQLVAGIQATGNLKNYQLLILFFNLISFFISYLLFEYNYEPTAILFVFIFSTLIMLYPQFLIFNKQIGISFKNYFNEVIYYEIIVLFSSCLISICMIFFISNYIQNSFLNSLIIIFNTFFMSFHFGLKKLEKHKLILLIKNSI